MPGIRFQSRLEQYPDSNGDPLAGGSLTFYESGTSDLAAVYLDIDLADEGENPHELDADGRQSTDIFLDVEVDYRVVLKDSTGAVVAEEDPTTGSSFASELAAHNADVNAHVTATTTNRGVVHELANDAEALAKSDTQRVLTPSNLAALGASKTFAGFVEQATDAETEAGTDDSRYTSPANLQALQATAAEILSATAGDKHFMGSVAFAANITRTADDLSIRLPGGATVKFGKRTSTIDGAEAFTFGAAFPTNCDGVITMMRGDGEESDTNLLPSDDTPPTTTGFTIDRDGSAVTGSRVFYFAAWGN